MSSLVLPLLCLLPLSMTTFVIAPASGVRCWQLAPTDVSTINVARLRRLASTVTNGHRCCYAHVNVNADDGGIVVQLAGSNSTSDCHLDDRVWRPHRDAYRVFCRTHLCNRWTLVTRIAARARRLRPLLRLLTTVEANVDRFARDVNFKDNSSTTTSITLTPDKLSPQESTSSLEGSTTQQLSTLETTDSATSTTNTQTTTSGDLTREPRETVPATTTSETLTTTKGKPNPTTVNNRASQTSVYVSSPSPSSSSTIPTTAPTRVNGTGAATPYTRPPSSSSTMVTETVASNSTFTATTPPPNYLSSAASILSKATMARQNPTMLSTADRESAAGVLPVTTASKRQPWYVFVLIPICLIFVVVIVGLTACLGFICYRHRQKQKDRPPVDGALSPSSMLTAENEEAKKTRGGAGRLVADDESLFEFPSVADTTTDNATGTPTSRSGVDDGGSTMTFGSPLDGADGGGLSRGAVLILPKSNDPPPAAVVVRRPELTVSRTDSGAHAKTKGGHLDHTQADDESMPLSSAADVASKPAPSDHQSMYPGYSQ